MRNWHTLTKEETLGQLNTTSPGLSDDEVAKRQKEHGPNRLEEAKSKPAWRMLLGQFTERSESGVAAGLRGTELLVAVEGFPEMSWRWFSGSQG